MSIPTTATPLFRIRQIGAALLGALTVIGGTIGITSATASPARPLAAGDWPTYQKDNGRSGDATDLAPVSTLSTAWHATLDGAVFGQPLVIGSEVLAATENDTVYGLNATTGAVRFVSPTLSGQHAYVGTTNGVVAIGGA